MSCHCAYSDFRESKTLMRGVQFAVFGLGDSTYAQAFNTAATALHAGLARLKYVTTFELWTELC